MFLVLVIGKIYVNVLVIVDKKLRWFGDCVLVNIWNDREICFFVLSVILKISRCFVYKVVNYDLR